MGEQEEEEEGLPFWKLKKIRKKGEENGLKEEEEAEGGGGWTTRCLREEYWKEDMGDSDSDSDKDKNTRSNTQKMLQC